MKTTKRGLVRNGIAAAAAVAALVTGELLSPRGNAQTFTTTDAAIQIPDNQTSTAGAVCQSIVVAGGPASITDVNVQVSITHTWVGDLHIFVSAPGGSPTLTLVNRAGRQGTGIGDSSDLSSAFPITFNDQLTTVGAEQLGGSNAGETGCASAGIIGSSAGCTQSVFNPGAMSTDAPVASSGSFLEDFSLLDANGTWQLCVVDSASGDTGPLTTWSLGFGALPVEIQKFSVE